MPSQLVDSLIFRDFYSTDAMRSIFDDRYLAQCWCDVEAALARAQAKLGIVPQSAAAEITRQAQAAELDYDKLRAGTNLVGYPILPLVRQLAARCTGEAGRYVHWGATTQDIMDTGNVLQLRAALTLIEQDVAQLITGLAKLAVAHRDTVMAGRTHGQHALPVTFGFKVAVWVDELQRHAERLAQSRPRLLRCSFNGAAGTLASLGDQGWAVHQGLAAELDLAPAAIAWHTARDSFAEFVALCGLLTATLGKMAREVAVLQQNEFGELEEPFVHGKGSSSTMPQKRNPILCEAVIGIAQLTRQHVPSMLSAMQPEHERAMGEWHVEWDLLPHVSQLTAAALQHSLAIFDGLVVHPMKMRQNLDLTNGQIVAEAVMMHLGQFIGRQQAHDVVYDACVTAVAEGRSLYSVLAALPEITAVVPDAALRRMLDPANYTGQASLFIDNVVGKLGHGRDR
ncbi:MAG: adenylosuccinate lyase family protein [Caldilineaceae bacterium]|nr:adenylosuccinate lyase family protein [Caldilineaceae bacterium]